MLTVPDAWQAALAHVDLAPLERFLGDEATAGKQIFPAADDRFRALTLTPPDAVRVVLLGQDPYHGAGQAHGLSFSVRPGVRTPASLRNIYKELDGDLGIPAATHGFLEHWARHGVLLLNTVLTVESGKAGSHRKRGWEAFTDAVIAQISAQGAPSVFMLWGNPAKEKAVLIDDVATGGRHLVLSAAHPSPLAQGKFFGSRHFSKANAFLEAEGRGTIDWALPPL
ncbi:uracil-DNA glycosylase [Sphingomonas qilianensis]|uniref:Uracil-DNA glycosylase n=1 Tax=Sphingomonas qilianensis TaxID=1736690 RepID=A0ABU9XWA0_9SPHN